jgi:hypothetical protein
MLHLVQLLLENREKLTTVLEKQKIFTRMNDSLRRTAIEAMNCFSSKYVHSRVTAKMARVRALVSFRS